jgi:hypothetical protein
MAGYEVSTQKYLRSFLTPELKSPYQITHNTTLQKFCECHSWPQMDVKDGHFGTNTLGPLLLPSFSGRQVHFTGKSAI